MIDWQPIETAPDDRPIVVLQYFWADPGHTEVAKEAVTVYPSEPYCWRDRHGNLIEDATHWCELEAPGDE